MADAVRRLIRITTANAASAQETARAATALGALADELESLVPQTAPPRYAGFDPGGTPGGARDPRDLFPYDVVLGPYNPLALPVEVEWQPPRAVGRARFSTPYEGPPGCVHGAVLAGAFDQVFVFATLMSGPAGPTASLSLEYRAPTPLGEPLVFEGWVERVEGRRIETAGEVRHGERVPAVARGVFIAVDRERILRMAERARGGAAAEE